MNAYIIQEFNNVDKKWQNVCLSSSSNGIYVDEEQARTIYELFKRNVTNAQHLRLITCKLMLVSAECNNIKVDFRNYKKA